MKPLKEESFYVLGKFVKYTKVKFYPCLTCSFYKQCRTPSYIFLKCRKKYFRKCGMSYNYKEI